MNAGEERRYRTDKVDVVVVGAGVIGVCTAYFLAKHGCRVTILDRAQPGSGCSYGNAGLITPSLSGPIAGPGVIRRALKYMLHEDSPLLIRLRPDWRLLSWLAQFARNCRQSAMDAAIPVLRDLSRASLRLFEELIATEDLAFDYERRGLLAVYTSMAGWEAGMREANLLRDYGLQPQPLDCNGARALEPSLLESVAGAVFFPEDAHGDSFRFACQMSQAAMRLGVECLAHTNVTGVEAGGNHDATVHTNKGPVKAARVVLTTGAWAPELLRQLRVRIPVQPAKGYSITMDRQVIAPRIPLLNMDMKVAITPIGNRLRFAGTLEFAGLDLKPNATRTQLVLRGGTGIIPEIRNPQNVETWCGLRPCTPDGLPIIDAVPGHPNIYLSAGHGMLGYTLGPVSGQLLAELIVEKHRRAPLHALGFDRFAGHAVH